MKAGIPKTVSTDKWGDFSKNTEVMVPTKCPLDTTLAVTHCQQGETERQEAAVATRTGLGAILLGQRYRVYTTYHLRELWGITWCVPSLTYKMGSVIIIPPRQG